MISRQELIQAIAALESQRSPIGDNVVDTALRALQNKLSTLVIKQTRPIERQQQLTVLVADLSGFTAMADRLDAEQVGDTINAVWQQLDGIVEAWGGAIDKHVGDGMIAHFGLRHSRKNEPVFAIEAALEMQKALTLGAGQIEDGRDSRAELGMRIGIHTGSVSVGQVGLSESYTAVGETVTIAEHLEQAGPVGGILVSEVVSRAARKQFDCQEIDSLIILGHHVAFRAFRIVDRYSDAGYVQQWDDFQTNETLIGRTSELEQLQFVLQSAADGNMSQLALLVGDEGMGKARLLQEFLYWLRFFPTRVNLLRGQCVPQPDGTTAQTVWREIIAGYFNIRARFSRAVARHDLYFGLSNLFEAYGCTQEQTDTYTTCLIDWLGFGTVHVELETELVQLALAKFLTAVASQDAAVIIMLENLQFADETLFEQLEQLVALCNHDPVLFACTGTNDLIKTKPDWQSWAYEPFSPYTVIEIPKLSPIDTRHQAMADLKRMSTVPQRLLDLVATLSEGNVAYLSELIRYFIGQDIILPESPHWQVQMVKLNNATLPSNLGDILQYRFKQLEPDLQIVLEMAAVVGYMFFDATILYLGRSQNSKHSTREIRSTLVALEEQGFIQRRPKLVTDRWQAYQFSYDFWRETAYAQMDLSSRRQYHVQIAAWFITNHERHQLRGLAKMIADHYGAADDPVQAAAWLHRNGTSEKMGAR